MFDGLSTEVTLLNQFKDADSTGVGMLYLVVIWQNVADRCSVFVQSTKNSI